MRPALEWLLDNPRRFAMSVLGAVLAVVIGVTALTDPGPPARASAPVSAPPTRSPSAPTSAPERAPTPTPSATVTVTATPRERPPERGQVERAAAAWVTDWLAADRPAGEWRAQMAAHATDHLTALMRTANPAGVPHTRLVSVHAVQASSTFALVDVRLANRDRLSVSVVLEPDGWRVAQVGAGTVTR